jgi:hypothetical protein
MRKLVASVCGPCLGLALSACAAAPNPPPEPAPARAEPTGHEEHRALTMRSELGTVDPAAIKRTFSTLEGAFLDCQKRALDRVEVLSGQVKFFLRIAADGSARYAYLEETDVGDRDTERCLRDIVTGAHWARPEGGGEAEARYSMELPLQSARPPNDWSGDKIAHVLGKNGAAIDRCKTGSEGAFRATMYVGPGGKVLSAGVTASNREAQDKADCLVDVLLRMKGLPTPGSWPAKVSFGL